VVLAVPVIAAGVAARFRGRGGAEVVALAEPQRLTAVGAWYRDFRQLEDSRGAGAAGAGRGPAR
jgi:predicted phosphoribosyltransferase